MCQKYSNIKHSTPLVSIVVVTFNSASTIIETLESIKNQTYHNIELIITDDCSSDDTVHICNCWLKENVSRFVNIEIVTTSQNTGVSGNMNRGIRQSHGAWIKSIAGDDLLIPSAIEEYVRFVENNPENVQMCVCDVDCFSEKGIVPQKYIESYAYYFKQANSSYQNQRNNISYKSVFVGPTYFYSRELFDKVGGYSEEYGMSEEWPFTYKVIMTGNRIYALNKKLVRYRVSASSLSHKISDNSLISPKLFQSLYKFFFDHPYKDLKREHRYLAAWHYAVHFKTWNYCYKTNNSWLSKNLHKYYIYFSPYVYLRKMGLVV